MKLSRERILTTHVGSLPRPDDLVALLTAQERGQADAAALQARLAQAVREVVAKQRAVGVDVVNDGEMGKINYATYVKERLTGFAGEDAPRVIGTDLQAFPAYLERIFARGGIAIMKRPVCTGPISHRGREALATDIANLKAALAADGAAEGFMNSASPGVVALFLGNSYYRSHDAYLWALAEAMRIEYEAITDSGLILQIDAPDLAMGRHIQFGDKTTAEFRTIVERHVEAVNYATRHIAPEQMRLHLCWGNYDGPHHHDVPLAAIIDVVLRARPAGISFEGANPRHEHEWKVWRDAKVADGKVLIPGVLTSTSNFIEHPELVADRICRYAAIVGRERVLASTDCGMSTTAGFPKVDPDIGWAKYAAMAEGARLASQRLWP
ncbi:MAG: cobalamin-independent methionine synthase II family protein [Alphaproteobacteria bacterium]|nr:cobalamin-independent methionine synthase II family protein [Alphaproteobacteria bacterium]